jgi:hypothetical protein
MIDLQIESAQLERMAREVDATDAQLRQALNSTLRKMAAWMRTRSVKGLSQALEIQQKLIRRRLKTFKVKQTANGPEITLWYGLDPMALIYLQAKKTGAGVSASGGRTVKGAFIAHGRGNNLQVFKRRGTARLPLDKQSAPVQTKAEEFLESKLINAFAFEAQFFKTFEHELSWRMQ